MSMKKKKNEPTQISSRAFVIWWIAGHVIGWVLFAFFINAEILKDDSFFAIAIFSALTLGLPIALVQSILMPALRPNLIKYWFAVTMIGWGLGWGLLTFINPSEPAAVVVISIVFVTPAILQWMLLRPLVRSSWLWILASVVSAFTFLLPIDPYSAPEYLVFALAALLQAGVTAVTMQWLLSTADRITGDKQKPF